MNVIVNGVYWDIVEVSGNDISLRRSDNVSVLGVTDNRMHTVYICNSLNDYMKTKVLTHEMCHVFCFSYGVSMPIETEELIADYVATYGRDIIAVSDMVLKEIFQKKFSKKILR